MGCKDSKEELEENSKKNRKSKTKNLMGSEHEMHSIVVASQDYRLSKRLCEGGYGEIFLLETVSKKNESKMKYSQLTQLVLKKGDLLSLIRKHGCLPENDVKFYAAEILLAMECLHNNKIIHKDIKPENVLICQNGHIKLTDFGISIRDPKQNAGNNANNNLKNAKIPAIHMKSSLLLGEDQLQEIADKFHEMPGTLQYSSPEVIQQACVDKACDYWGLGILIFLMLRGYHPFLEQEDEIETLKNILSGNILLYSISVPLSTNASTLIDALLNPNPIYRLGTKGASEVKQHPFFKDIDWEEVNKLNLQPPFIPDPNISTFIGNFEQDEGGLEFNENKLHGSNQSVEFGTIPNFTFDNELLISPNRLNNK